MACRSDAAALAGAATVRRWLAHAGYTEAERDRRLALLAGFCHSIGQCPDELVAGLLRPTRTGDLAISGPLRRTVDAAIDEFVGTLGLSGKDAVVVGNTLRSFLIHNGVFIQGRPWRG